LQRLNVSMLRNIVGMASSLDSETVGPTHSFNRLSMLGHEDESPFVSYFTRAVSPPSSHPVELRKKLAVLHRAVLLKHVTEFDPASQLTELSTD
jgi:hypothetical protein